MALPRTGRPSRENLEHTHEYMLAYARRMAAASLQGIAESDLSENIEEDANLLVLPLSGIGDGLRFGVSIPESVERWAKSLKAKDLAQTMHASIADLEDARAFYEPDNPFGAWIRTRDRVESVMVAISWIYQFKMMPAVVTRAGEYVGQHLARTDAQIRQAFRRRDLRLLLSNRVAAMDEPNSWIARLYA